MSIGFSGGMVVGAIGDNITLPEGLEEQRITLYEWLCDDNGMEAMCAYYDCEEDSIFFGFGVPDINVSDIDGSWLVSIKKLGEKFKRITGAEAQLIGTQNIT